MNEPVPKMPARLEIVYVTFLAEINPTTAENLLAVMAKCVGQGVKTVHLAISTPGGEVSSGIALYNALRAMPFKLVTHNIGNVDSIGNAVFLAGGTRYACKHSTFMFHGVGFNFGNQAVRLEEKNAREMLENILVACRSVTNSGFRASKPVWDFRADGLTWAASNAKSWRAWCDHGRCRQARSSGRG